MVNKLLLMKKRGLVPGAVAYWDCTQVVGQVLPDLSGNGNHATLGSTAGADTNDPTATGQGLVFGGDDFVTCGTIPAIASGNPYTVQIVAAFDDATSGVAFAQNSGTSATGKKGMLIQAASTQKIQFLQYDADASLTQRYCQSTDTITAGAYYVITAVYDGAAIRLYLNETQQGPDLATGYSPDTAHAATLGKNAYYTSGYLTGDIAAVLVYPVGLSAAQVAQNHAYFRAKFAPLGVVLP